MARQDLIQWTATFAGRPWGEFAGATGGALTSEDVKHSPGARKQERSRGGRPTLGNLTLTREFDPAVDDETFIEQNRGKPDLFQAHKQRVDPDGNAYGPAKTYIGTLINYEPGEADANGDAIDESSYEISVSRIT